jgi:F-type H+-transporting ATPase subunit b
MLIDPITVVAQIVNFLILMALLKHFLYDRVLNAMDAREERIWKRLESAREREEEAEETLAEYQDRKRELEDSREAEMEKARDAAEERRNELIDKARREVDRKKEQWQRALREDREALLRDLRNRAGERVLAVCRKVLADLTDAELQAQALRRFLGRLKENDLASAEGEVNVRTGFELSDEQREKLADALGVSADDLDVETDADLILGVEARIGDQKVAWSAEDYLSELEAAVRERLDKAMKSDESPGAGDSGDGGDSSEEASEDEPEESDTGQSSGPESETSESDPNAPDSSEQDTDSSEERSHSSDEAEDDDGKAEPQAERKSGAAAS